MSGLADRIKAYLEDAPLDGRHSDAAGGNAYELLEEAEYDVRALAAIPQWQPIDTAPMHMVQAFNRFPCLLQEKNTRRVVEGYGRYMQFGGAKTPMKLRWYTAGDRLVYPEYWMPLPAPKVETPDA